MNIFKHLKSFLKFKVLKKKKKPDLNFIVFKARLSSVATPFLTKQPGESTKLSVLNKSTYCNFFIISLLSCNQEFRFVIL